MYIAICDDHPEESQVLSTLLDRWQEERRTSLRYKVFSSAADMLRAAGNEHFTTYLLDVMMPGTDGLAAAREIRSYDSAAKIIFCSSSTSFAYESYSVQAMNYLLKPVHADTLFPILDQLVQTNKLQTEYLTLRSSSTLIRIPVSQLTYVEVNGKHLYFNLNDGSVRQVYGSLKDYEDQLLCRPEFMQVHRSYIVNMLQMSVLSPTEAQTFSGKTIPVSRRIFPQLQKDYMTLLFAEREV